MYAVVRVESNYTASHFVTSHTQSHDQVDIDELVLLRTGALTSDGASLNPF